MKTKDGTTFFPDHLDKITRSAEETQLLGRRLGELAQPGDLFLLVGNLGAGKTCLAQGIARGLEVKEHAMSPSFVLVREYRGRLPFYHIDFYRLNRIGEIEELGLDEYLSGKGVCVVEWAEKGLSALPSEHMLVRISFLSPLQRQLHFEARGVRYMEILHQLQHPFTNASHPGEGDSGKKGAPE